MDEVIATQQTLLQAHRQTLAIYLHQLALLGVAHAPPAIINGIAAARAEIRAIKQALCAQHVLVADDPSDESALSAPDTAMLAAAPRESHRVIKTGGGTYVEGNVTTLHSHVVSRATNDTQPAQDEYTIADEA